MNYETVPTDILTGKDIDYLSDMFEWNYLALKDADAACDMVDDEEIVGVLDKACSLFDDNLNSILNILESRGQQVNNQISNTKVEVAKGISLNEKDYLTCLNSKLKGMAKNYAMAMTEASNESLYEIYRGIHERISTLQRETYELMFKKGWYVLEKCDTNKINTKYQTLQQEYSDLNG